MQQKPTNPFVSKHSPRRRDCDDDNHDQEVDASSVDSTFFLCLRNAWKHLMGKYAFLVEKCGFLAEMCTYLTRFLGELFHSLRVFVYAKRRRRTSELSSRGRQELVASVSSNYVIRYEDSPC